MTLPSSAGFSQHLLVSFFQEKHPENFSGPRVALKSPVRVFTAHGCLVLLTDYRARDCLFLQVTGFICMRGADILPSTRVPRPLICKGLSRPPFSRSHGERLRGFRIKWAHLHGLVLKRQLERGRQTGADNRGSRGTHCPPRGRHGGSIVRGAGLFSYSLSPPGLLPNPHAGSSL